MRALGFLVAALLVLLAGWVGLSSWQTRETPAEPGSGTRSMAKRLADIADAAMKQPGTEESGRWWAINHPVRVKVLRERLAKADNEGEQIRLRFALAHELLSSGDSEAALAELEALESEIDGEDSQRYRSHIPRLQSMIGVAALRIAEQQNCIHHHSAESCLFPIAGGGLHRERGGSQRAVVALTRQLELQPDSLGARWLLNVAYMTLGQYPDGVPEAWRLAPELFASEADIGRFPNRAKDVGLDTIGLAGGGAMDDFDGDGRMDIVASSCGLSDQLHFLHNDGKGKFIDRTSEAGLIGELGGLNINHADFDNDGDPDVLVLRGGWRSEHGRHPNSLLRNNGDGTFDDVTEAAGVLSYYPTQVAAWGDYDNDGDLDLFIGNEQKRPEESHPSELYRNNGNGTFTDVAAELGVAELCRVKGAAWGDYDNDRHLDLYVSCWGRPNMLFHNEGSATPRFRDVAASAGVQEPKFSFPVWFWDYDNDGWQDLYVGSWNRIGVDAVAARYLGQPHRGELPRLFRNQGDGTFRDVTKQTRLDRVLLTMGANYGDLDNDGFLDLYLGTGAPDLRTLMPNRMFRNDAGRVFQDVTTSGGFGHLQKGHGVAFGDIDNDGDQDIFSVMGGWVTGDFYQNALFVNPGHERHWITVALEGTHSNRSGVGARLKLQLRTAQGSRTVHVTAGTGGSFGSSTLQQEIGLGQALAIESLEVSWPVTGKTQRFTDVAMDRFFKIREGDATLHDLERPRISF